MERKMLPGPKDVHHPDLSVLYVAEEPYAIQDENHAYV
jgi:hypothetical protein